MTVSPSSAPPGSAPPGSASPGPASPHPVVTRVLEYEPPVVGAAAVALPGSPTRERHLTVVRPATPASPNRLAATSFVDAALRSVLEVIDQRRPAAQLGPLLVAGLADTVVALSRAQGQRRAAAVLRRARLQAVDEHDNTFEVAAVYSRGPRNHALACRVERTATPRGLRWQLTALHLG